MNKQDLIQSYLPTKLSPADAVEAFAPSNIALCKYWGKRQKELNLPVNSSLSISLGELGSRTRLSLSQSGRDEVWLNGQQQNLDTEFASKALAFLDLFRGQQAEAVCIDTHNSIPTAAGLASSASGFAALMKAIDQFYRLNLTPEVLSAFARIGSGSASRSIYTGFVEWHKGSQDDGMDSHAVPLNQPWPELRVGLLTLTDKAKAVGSRTGMQRTTETASLYQSWPQQAAEDLVRLKRAIEKQNFTALGETAEQNALSMHATMIASWPPLLYWQPESVATMQRIWQLRDQGLPLYFTMDAGPNIKLLFESGHEAQVKAEFPQVQVVDPFASDQSQT